MTQIIETMVKPLFITTNYNVKGEHLVPDGLTFQGITSTDRYKCTQEESLYTLLTLMLGSRPKFDFTSDDSSSNKFNLIRASNRIAKVSRRGAGNIYVSNEKTNDLMDESGCLRVLTHRTVVIDETVPDDLVVVFYRGHNQYDRIAGYLEEEQELIVHPKFEEYFCICRLANVE